MMEDFWEDVKAFGGTPAFVFAIIFSFLLGYEAFALKLAVGYVASFALTAIVRLVYFKRRPDKTGYTSLISKIDAASFPSLHTMRAFLLATLLSLQFPNMWLGLFLFAFALGTAVVRVARKRHYAMDVLVGGLIGIVIAVVINTFI